ncbi:bifunctional enoyl-CoA hydratase/phosphate acetyltransferase [Pseudahrensia aquimaris]|uniref:Bifunctional enoyl-CoA hydratase/phosphate acetyltransferase n=1 Tax=Pseudahrensia aquimaris TaxID=744461 RepID=A0ABW3FIK7_9HYPH
MAKIVQQAKKRKRFLERAAAMTEITAKTRPHFHKLLQMCADLPALRTAVICPEEANALEGALDARDAGLIAPILVGDRSRIEMTANAAGLNIEGLEIVQGDTEEAAAHRGVDLVSEGKADALMKGYIHSDTYLAAVIRKENGLRGKGRTSHCFVMDVPNWPRPVIITDAALNVAPELKHLIAITQNGLDLARALGIETPKAAILSATETPNPGIPSSMVARQVADAAKAGQITGGEVDGPFALDNAVSIEAAELKGIKSSVAGDADILVVPNIEAGNIFFKALTFMGGGETSGLVVGATAPVILTSRADSAEARLASSALAVLYNEFLKTST